MAAGRSTSSVRAHRDDVNAVEYLDAGCEVVLTGSDDNLIKARSLEKGPGEGRGWRLVAGR
jgi:hypothetical protein